MTSAQPSPLPQQPCNQKNTHLQFVNNPSDRDYGPTAKQSGEVIKICYTNIYSNIIVYQKYIGTSIKVGWATHSLYARSGSKAEGVQTNDQRGRETRTLSPLRRFRKGPSYSPNRLVSQSATLKEAVKGTSSRPIVLSMIAKLPPYFFSIEPFSNMKRDFYLDKYIIFQSDLINKMDHMRISGTEHSSVILGQIKSFKKLKSDAPNRILARCMNTKWNYKIKNSCIQWDSNHQPSAFEPTALTIAVRNPAVSTSSKLPTFYLCYLSLCHMIDVADCYAVHVHYFFKTLQSVNVHLGQKSKRCQILYDYSTRQNNLTKQSTTSTTCYK